MKNLNEANEYLAMHIEKEAWIALSEEEQMKSLEMAERYINSAFTLRNGIEDNPVYLQAICEQAIHLLVFDKERMKLQREGVSSYKVDDLSFQMDNSVISPIASAFLKKYNYKQLGEIV